MTLPSKSPSPRAPLSSLRFIDELPELEALFDRSVNVVALTRAPSAPLLADAARALEQPGFKRLFTVAPGSAQEAVQDELAAFPSLADDVLTWVELITDLTDAKLVGIRLARLTAAMCPRFHSDRVTVRLVTTYIGRGTEFVASEHVDRQRLGHAAQGVPDERSGLLLAPDCVRAANPFDVVFLKGSAWPGNADRGAVHRSPAASPTAPRLVLTLDPL